MSASAQVLAGQAISLRPDHRLQIALPVTTLVVTAVLTALGYYVLIFVVAWMAHRCRSMAWMRALKPPGFIANI